MKSSFGHVLTMFSIVFALHGCIVQSTDENAGPSQDEPSSQEIVARPRARCALPIKTGPCRAYFPRYAFDTSVGRCVQFIYGGCQGNSNNFESYEECRDSCERFTAP